MRATVWVMAIALGLGSACGTQRVDRADRGRHDALTCVETRSAQGRDAQRVAELCSRRTFGLGTERYRGGYLEALACVRERGGQALEAVTHCR